MTDWEPLWMRDGHAVEMQEAAFDRMLFMLVILSLAACLVVM